MRIRYPLLYLVLFSTLVAGVLLAVGGGRQDSKLGPSVLSRERVALIDVSGIITTASGGLDGVASSSRIIELLEEYADDDSVKAVILRIDSPGGTVVAAQEIFGALERFRTDAGKPVVVSMADIAASGGYYISCAADWVLANPGTITGSIGVIMEFPSLEKLFGKIGVGTNTIKSGPFKDTGSAFRTMTDAEREVLQQLIDDVYGQFVEAVSEGRGMPLAEVKTLADGRIYSGRAALELGLVDEIGDLERAVMKAGELAGIKGRPSLAIEKKRMRIWDYLEGRARALFPLPAPGLSPGSARLLYLWK